jgi:hypothetical protein
MSRKKTPTHASGVLTIAHRQSDGGFTLWLGNVTGPASVVDGRETIVRLTRAELGRVLGTIPALSLPEELVRPFLDVGKFLTEGKEA